MKKSRYANGGDAVPVGFLDTDNAVYLAADTASGAFAADTVVRVTPTTSDAWIAIGTAPTATADTDGNHLVPFGSSQDFAIDKADKLISTQPINVTPFK